ncbi:MAG: hypothetical protein IJO78_06795 [Erysipelotrichaceae bacterium]|nr:hypothetical protein [Erysipelotrichaceae bacterium]
MMFGLATNKGFISVLCIGYFMFVSAICSVQMDIMENRMSFYQSLDEFDKFVYLEVIVMHRIKDSFVMELNEDCTLVYDDYVIIMDYEQQKVKVTYQMMNREIVREYLYDLQYHYLEVNPV